MIYEKGSYSLFFSLPIYNNGLWMEKKYGKTSCIVSNQDIFAIENSLMVHFDLFSIP